MVYLLPNSQRVLLSLILSKNLLHNHSSLRLQLHNLVILGVSYEKRHAVTTLPFTANATWTAKNSVFFILKSRLTYNQSLKTLLPSFLCFLKNRFQLIYFTYVYET